MNSHQRNLWPIGILFIILIGVVLIIFSIRISSKQSIDTDKSFDSERKEVDIHINDIMSYQNEFEKFYTPYIGINRIPELEQQNILKNPYYTASVPKDYPIERDRLHHDNNTLYLFFHRKDMAATNSSYEEQSKQESENINADFLYPVISQVSLEVTRLVQGEKKATSFVIPVQKYTENTYKIENFSLPLQGYYQLYFKVTTCHNQNLTHVHSSLNDKCKNAFFSYWIFNGNP